MDVLSSTPVTLWVDFEAPQGLVIADVGSVNYSLYDGTGTPITLAQVLTPEVEATGVTIPIPAIHQVIAPSHSFERRQVVVNYRSGGQSYQRRLVYRVVELPRHSATPADVRTYLALNEDELRDDESDLFSAVLHLEALIGKQTLDTALASGTLDEIRATRAVVLCAAQLLFPSLRYRIAQAKTDGTLKFERLKDTAAFDGLVAETADALLTTALGFGYTPVDTGVPVILLLGTLSTDPITGIAPATSVGG